MQTGKPSRQTAFDGHVLLVDQFSDCVVPFVPVCYSICNRQDDYTYLGPALLVGETGTYGKQCRNMQETYDRRERKTKEKLKESYFLFYNSFF